MDVEEGAAAACTLRAQEALAAIERPVLLVGLVLARVREDESSSKSNCDRQEACRRGGEEERRRGGEERRGGGEGEDKSSWDAANRRLHLQRHHPFRHHSSRFPASSDSCWEVSGVHPPIRSHGDASEKDGGGIAYFERARRDS
eukprot:766612-Hanusia_phi.AAC.1